jgi:hypothetical protein
MPSESGKHRFACQGNSKCDSPGVFLRKLAKDGSGWENGPDKWVEVPGERVTPPYRRPHVPFGIACWRSGYLFLSGGFSCFTPGTDT